MKFLKVDPEALTLISSEAMVCPLNKAQTHYFCRKILRIFYAQLIYNNYPIF